MNYRIKDICKEKGITLSELADRIDMKSANLSVSLSDKGNPTMSTLTKIADALNVDFIELFVPKEDGTTGYIEHKGEIYKISSVEDIEKLLEEIKR